MTTTVRPNLSQPGDAAPVENATRARQGVTLGTMRYVLGIGLILAAVCLFGLVGYFN